MHSKDLLMYVWNHGLKVKKICPKLGKYLILRPGTHLTSFDKSINSLRDLRSVVINLMCGYLPDEDTYQKQTLLFVRPKENILKFCNVFAAYYSNAKTFGKRLISPLNQEMTFP